MNAYRIDAGFYLSYMKTPRAVSVPYIAYNTGAHFTGKGGVSTAWMY